MSVTFAIVSLLDTMPLGAIFTTRQLIGVGSRGAIDQCLSRLVDSGAIQRLANGVFAKGEVKPEITPLELAQIKAGAFHKQVYEHAHTTAKRLAYVPKSHQHHQEQQSDQVQPAKYVFATNGRASTSFNSIFGRVSLQAVSARKYHEDRNEVWEVLKAIWYLGKDGFNAKIRGVITKYWGRKSQESLHNYASFVPHWLFEQFPQDYEAAFKAKYLNANPAARFELDRRYEASGECQEVVRNMPPGFNTFEPPERTPEDYAEWFAQESESDSNSESNRCCCPDDPECICPVFTCTYCQNQPIRNKFNLVFG